MNVNYRLLSMAANALIIVTCVMMLIGAIGVMASLGAVKEGNSDIEPYGFCNVLRVGAIVGFVGAIGAAVISFLTRQDLKIPGAKLVASLVCFILNFTLYMFSSEELLATWALGLYSGGYMAYAERLMNEVTGAQVRAGFMLGLALVLCALAAYELYRTWKNPDTYSGFGGGFNNGYNQYPQYAQQPYPQNSQIPQQPYPQNSQIPQQPYPQAPQAQQYTQQQYPQNPQNPQG